jgi:hypothetical protein
MATHHVDAGKEMRIVGPAKVQIQGAAFETHFTIEDFVPENPPTVTSLSPDTAVSGDPDFTLYVSGENFTAQSVIHFGLNDEPTTHNADGTLSTGVKPSLFAPAEVDVTVRTGPIESEPATFTFTAPAGTRAKRR